MLKLKILRGLINTDLLQEKVWIPQLQTPTTGYETTLQVSPKPEASFEIDGNLIKFTVVRQGTNQAVLRAMKRNGKELGRVTFDMSTASSDKVSSAVVTSMDLSTGLSGDTHFLALAVDSKIKWPGDSSDPDDVSIMKINE